MLMISAIGLGVFLTQNGIVPYPLIHYSNDITDYALYMLLFFVGFEIGRDKESMKRLFTADRFAFVVPIGTIIGTFIGGVLAGIVLQMEMKYALAIASGFGWYSLSAVMITKSIGADMGSIAFLANVFRETISIVSIPIIAKRINGFVAIAPAGATSMDTTLPIIQRYGGDEAAVVAFIHGFVLSALVPVCVSFFI
ncbi:MAG: lysine exporter LysO family protein [Calditerrivibrio sp.]|nr:lysine exporter LysO family protein [Calditerrivibrio sp.]